MELEKFKASHFDNIEELIKTCKMWIKDDDYEAYCRFFDMGAMEELIKEIQQLEKERDGIYQDYQDLGKEYHKLQEESISKAVVEEQIGKINELLPDINYHDIKDKQEREYYKKEFMKYITVRNYLQGLLNKGE